MPAQAQPVNRRCAMLHVGVTMRGQTQPPDSPNPTHAAAGRTGVPGAHNSSRLVWSMHLWLSKRHRWAWARPRCCWLVHARATGVHRALQPDSGCVLEYLHLDEPHSWERGTRTGAAGGRAGAPGAGRALRACQGVGMHECLKCCIQAWW